MAFLIVAGVLAGYAVIVEAWWAQALLAWFCASFVSAAIVYLGDWLGAFGKRRDGSLRLLNIAVFLPFLLLTWATWRLAVACSREPAWHRIDARLICGRRLLSREADLAADHVLDLTAEFAEIPALRQRGYRCLPILDGRGGDLDRVAAAVRSLADAPGTVFIHCAGGHGRTGLVAAMLLMAREPGLSPEAAVTRLRQVRPGIGLNAEQWRTLQRFAATPPH